MKLDKIKKLVQNTVKDVNLELDSLNIELSDSDIVTLSYPEPSVFFKLKSHPVFGLMLNTVELKTLVGVQSKYVVYAHTLINILQGDSEFEKELLEILKSEDN